MADVNAEINISINSSQAVSQLRSLQAQVTAFNQSLVAGNVAAARAQKDLLNNLTTQINATKAFTTSMVDVETSAGRLGRAIDKNRLSLREYFRYGVAASGAMGKGMREHAEIMELAGDRVKRLQTQYVALSQAHNGVTRAMAIRPLQLHNADAAIGIQRQQIFNKLLHDGSTSLVNWGKNTQWAGRQLMVGFTVPLTIFGGIAGKIFMDLEKQIVQFKRVYGDLQTPAGEKSAMIKEIQDLGKEFTKYGITVSDTVALAAKAAATGAQGADLLAATTEATRLATLGQIDYQQALDATISLQTAFRISSEELADTTNFLNAVENQTVTSLDDITQAIPLVAPVIKGLGGDVKDLAIFMTAMREGGISANEGANALKSGLASLINPTKGAREQLEKVGINIDAILSKNKGDLRGLVMEFGQALGSLSKFERQQTLAKLFGKYQFARLGALFNNVSKEGSQAARVMDLTALSAKELGQIAEGELGQLEEAVGTKFTAAVEKLKLAIAPMGEAFLKIATPLIDFATMIAEKFNSLPDAAKTFITWATAIAGVLVPTLIMVVGLLGNFAGNMLKILAVFRGGLGRLRGAGAAFSYLAEEELDAMAASASLEGQTNSLTGALNVQRAAVNNLARAYGSYVASAGAAAANIPQGFRRPARRMATGGFVAGSGNKDSEPALLMPGEFVVNKKAAQKNASLLMAMNEGTLKGYRKGTQLSHTAMPFSPDSQQYQSSIMGYGLGPIIEKFGTSAVKVVSNLVAELTTSLNQSLKKGITKEGFTEEYGKTSNRFSAAAAIGSGGKFSMQEQENIAAMQKFEAELLKRIQGVKESSINDEILARETQKLIAEYRQTTGATQKLGDALYSASQSVGQVRVGLSKDQIMSGLASGMFSKVKGGTSVLMGKLGVGRLSQSGKVRPANPINPSRSYARTDYVARLMGLKATQASADGAGTNSPSDITMQQGRDVAKGMEMGIEQGTPAVQEAGKKMGQAAVSGSQSGAQWKPTPGGWLAGGASPYGPSPQQQGPKVGKGGDTGRFAPGTLPSSNPSRRDLGFEQEADDAKRGLKDFKGKLVGGMMAMDGLIFGMSMMNGAVGEFAQKIMPAAFAIQGVAMTVSMLGAPLALLLGAVGAAVAGLIWMRANSNKVAEEGVKLASAMGQSAKQIEAFEGFYGRKSIVSKQEAKEFGTTTAKLTKGQEFLATDLGKQMVSGFSSAMSSYGIDNSAKQFASKLGSMVLQGVLSDGQAENIANALEKELNVEGLAVRVKGELKNLIGPDGKDVLTEGVTVAVRLQEENQNSILAVQGIVGSALDAAQKAIDSNENLGRLIDIASERDLTLGPIPLDWLQDIAEDAAMGSEEVAEAKKQVVAYGAAVANLASAGYQNLEAAQIRYANALKRANEEEDPEKRKKMLEALKEEERLLKKLEKQTDKSNRQNIKFFDKQSNLVKQWMAEGARTTVQTMYEGTAMQMFSDSILSRTSGVKDQTVAFTIEASLASGALNPSVVEEIFRIVADDEVAAGKIALAIETAGIDDADRLFNGIAVLQDEGLKAEFSIQAPDLGEDDINAIANALEYISKLPDNVQKTLTAETFGTQEAINLNRVMMNFDELPENVSKKRVARFFRENFDKVYFGAKWFNNLPNSVQKNFLATYTIYFNEVGGLSAAGQAAFNKAFGAKPGDKGASGAPLSFQNPEDNAARLGVDLQRQANEAVDDIDVDVKENGNTDPSGGSDNSGGGNREKTWLEEKIEEFKANSRLYGTATKWLDKLKKDRGVFFGRIQQLRSGTRVVGKGKVVGGFARVPEQLIEEIGAGPEGLKRMQQLLGLSKKKFNQFIKQWKDDVAKRTVDTLRSGITEANRAKRASGILQGKGFSKEIADELSQDTDIVETLLTKTKEGGKALYEFIQLLKQSQALKAEEIKDPLEALEDAWSNYSSAVEAAFDLERIKQEELFAAKKYVTAEGEKNVDQIEKLIDKNEDLIQIQQDLVDSKQEEIDDYQRTNDLIQQRIDNLRREDEMRNRVAELLERDLQAIQDQETKIRDAYQKRIDALDKVAQINQRIINQQKNQISLAQALTEGDVYAAAQVAEDMRRENAEQANEYSKQSLQDAMENQIENLSAANGMRRREIEAQIAGIKEAIYQNSLLIRIEEDKIYQNNLEVRRLSNEIYDIEEDKIEPLEKQNEQYGRIIDKHKKELEYAVAHLFAAEMTTEEWNKAKLSQEALVASIVGSIDKINSYRDAWNAAADAARRARDAAAAIGVASSGPAQMTGTPNTTQKNGSWAPITYDSKGKGYTTLPGFGIVVPAYKYAGGMIKKFAKGSRVGSVMGDGSRDTVPSMLTPGEYVIRKSMVEKYGTPFFDSLNMGSFQMPRFRAPERVGMPNTSSAPRQSNNASVYNNSYSVNVNASGTNASPDQIANVVISKIRAIEQMSVRG